MKKRFSVFILMMFMLVGVFGSVPVCASGVNLGQAKFDSISILAEHDYKGSPISMPCSIIMSSISVDDYAVLGVRTEYGGRPIIQYCIVSDTAFKVSFTVNETWTGLDYETWKPYFSSGSGFVWKDTSTNGTVSYTYNYNSVSSSSYNGMYYVTLGSFSRCDYSNLGVDYGVPVASGYVFDISTNDFKSYDSTGGKYLISEIFKKYGDDFSKAPNVSIDEYVEYKEPVYNADLGCLQNIERKVIFKGATGMNQDYRFKYSYAYTTSTGFDLRSKGADVEYVIKIKGGYKPLIGSYVSLPTKTSQSYYAGNGMNFFYIDSETFNGLVSEFGKDMGILSSLDYVEYVYARPILKDGADVSYGMWAKIYGNDGDYKVDYGTTSNGNVSSENDSEQDDFSSVGSDDVMDSLGTGGDWSDAESNSRPNVDTSVDVDDLMQNAESLASQIGEIPQLIAVLFSFLPSWCLTLFGVGFGIIVLLIIYKLIRG